MKKTFIYSLVAACTMVSTSCKDEYLNPSSASETQVVNDVNGLIALANGLQYRLTVGRASPGYALPSAIGLTTKELKVLNAGNTDELNLESGGLAVQGTNSLVSNLWNQSHLVRANADNILNNVAKLTDPGTKSGLIAYASVFKAMALGNLATGWEQSPITTGDNAAFVPRADVLKAAIGILEAADKEIAATAPSATFTSRVVSGIDLKNTIQALIARYSLMLGDNDKALAAALKVDLTKKSSFSFDDNSRNPLFDATFSNRNVTEPTNQDFGLPAALKPAAKDKRIAFYFQTAVAANNLGRASFYTANTAGTPVYLPGEMLLIIAEANARKGNITAATEALNKVITKKTDVWAIGADLPAYEGEATAAAVLTEVYKQRCIELYMQGFKLEDSRRFGRPGAGTTGAERTRNFYPYPQAERDNNKSTPADPAI
jgi:starch-binding outer membrane protein, SusD/RagB family